MFKYLESHLLVGKVLMFGATEAKILRLHTACTPLKHG
jgi:hypothetical protein